MGATEETPYLFAGEQRDRATGLDYLRARYYDADLGRFISKDPFSGTLGDPFTQHDYQYAHANPVNNTDPTGYFSITRVLTAVGVSTTLSSIGATAGYIGYGLVTGGISGDDLLGLADQWVAGFGDGVSGGITTELRRLGHGTVEPSTVDQAFVWQMGNLAGTGLGFIVGNAPASAFSSTIAGVRWLGVAGKTLEFAGDAYGVYQAGQGLLDGQWEIGDIFNVLSIALFGVSAASNASTFLSTARSVNGAPSTAGTTSRAIPGSDDGLRAASRTEARAVGHCGNSFPEGTLVLMADGTTRPIEEVDPGDQVLADDPLDDLPAQVQTVVGRSSSTTRTWTTVEIDQDGDGIADGEITSTPNHLIWTEDGVWEEAVELEVGDRLLSADGSWLEVTNVQSNTVEEEITFDLDVEDIDSYFIFAADGSLLVHNCDYQSIYKAPQKGLGDILRDQGFHPKNFSDPDGDNLAYFAKQRRLAEEFARSYGDGVLEVQIPQDIYDSRISRYEFPYQGGPEIEIPIPHSEFDVLNEATRILHR